MKTALFQTLYSDPIHQTDSTLFGSYDVHSIVKIQKPKGEQLFTAHELQVTNHNYLPKKENNNDFFFSFLILDLAVIILFLSLYRKQFLLTIRAFLSSKYYQQIEQKSFIKHPITLSLFVAFIINTSLLILYIIEHRNILPDTSAHNYLFIYIAMALASYYIAKFIVIFISSYIFKTLKAGKVYINYILLWAINVGLLLSLFLWLVVYIDQSYLLNILIGLILFFEAIRLLYSSLLILPQTDYNFIHFFIYLCAVEILPLIVLGKIVMLRF